MLGGLSAAALLPKMALAQPVAKPLRELFDQIAAIPDPTGKLTAIKAFDVSRLSRADAAICRMVAHGIERETKAAGRNYAALLSAATASDLTPDALERQIDSETRVLLARADTLLRGFGLSRGSVGVRLRQLKQSQARYSNDGQGRTEAVADMNAALGRARPHLGEWFNPPIEKAASIGRMSAADEQATKRGYRDPPFYFPDLSAVQDRPRWTLVTVAYHETIPGHLLQLRRQALADPHPIQLKYAAGYGEGWAIYAESLVDRMGLLSPIEQLGFLQSLLFRLARVKADVGIHASGWDRPRAIRFLEDTVGFELFFPFATEVDRYFAEPARSAGDAVVALWLRDHGARLQGTRLRSFHDAVLNHGPLSIEALAEIAGR